jgi:hypothetical protein
MDPLLVNECIRLVEEKGSESIGLALLDETGSEIPIVGDRHPTQLFIPLYYDDGKTNDEGGLVEKHSIRLVTKLEKHGVWSAIRELAGLPSNHTIQSANLIKYPKGKVAGLGSHRDVHFDRHCRSVLLKISDEDEKVEGSLHIEGIPYPLRQGDMLCFSANRIMSLL